MKDGKWVPWRVAVGILGVLAIAYLWSTKELAAAYAGMPAEAVVPFIVTNVLVTLAKVAAMAAAVWLIKRGAGKLM